MKTQVTLAVNACFEQYNTYVLVIYSHNKKRKRFGGKLRDFTPVQRGLGAARVDRRVLIAGK
jgi:hypothetical protein